MDLLLMPWRSSAHGADSTLAWLMPCYAWLGREFSSGLHTSPHTDSIKEVRFFALFRTLKHALVGSKMVVYGSRGHIFGLHDWFGKSITSMYVKAEKVVILFFYEQAILWPALCVHRTYFTILYACMQAFHRGCTFWCILIKGTKMLDLFDAL